MTVAATLRRAGPYLCNGVTTAFPFAFKVFKAEDVRVVLADSIGVESDLTLTTHYTVALNANQDANPGGSIVTSVAYQEGNKLTVTSQIPVSQPTSLSNQGGFYPSVINDSLDRLTAIAQQHDEQLSRALLAPVSDPTLEYDLATTIAAAQRAIASAAQAAVSSDEASIYSAKAAATASTAASAATSIATAQAEINALIGIGIGTSHVDASGHLIMAYAGTVSNLAIDSSGHLSVTY